MNGLQHILRSLNNEKALRLYKAAVALMLSLLLALTPGLAFAIAGDEPVQNAAGVAIEALDETEEADFDSESADTDIESLQTAGDENVMSLFTAEYDQSEISAADDEVLEDFEQKAQKDLIADFSNEFLTPWQQKNGSISSRTQYERALHVHDYLIERFYFNPSNTTGKGVAGLQNEGSDDARGCSSESFYEAYVCLLKVVGIGGEENISQAKANGYVWNLVKLDGKWTHIDIATDQYLSKDNYGHLCFGLTDDEIQLVHQQYKRDSTCLASSSDNNYYRNLDKSKGFQNRDPKESEGLEFSYLIEAIEPELPKGEAFTVKAADSETVPTLGTANFKALVYYQIASYLDGQKFGGYTASVAYMPTTNSYSINCKNLISTVFSGSIANQEFTGSSLPAKLLFKKPVVQDKDYTVLYKSAQASDATYTKNAPYQAGSYKVKITGVIDYQGEIVADYKITPAAISKALPVEGSGWRNSLPYTGKPITQSTATLKFGSYVLRANDYDVVSHTNNTNPGQAGMTVRGKGNFTGTVTYSFAITGTANSGGSSTSNSSSSSNSGSGNNGATNITTQAAPSAPTVTGKWVKSGSRWWFKLDAKSQTALKGSKNYPAGRWVTISKKRYYFDGSGWMKTGWLSYSGKWYYLGSDGAMKTWWQKSGGKWYYMASDGIMQTGKKNIGKQTYYLNTSSGAMKTGWNKEGSTWYYYGSSGAMAKGWLKSGGKWYYLAGNGAMQTTKQTISGKTYNFNKSGVMLTGWNKESGTYYHYGSSGAMSKGWVKSGSKWYFMDKSTGAMKTAWVDDGGSRYFMHPINGDMLTGWNKITTTMSGKATSNFYYFSSSGALQRNKWIGNYYVESDGKMATNKWIGKYHVNASGLWDATKK